jgi:hypothetical protein
MWRRWRERLTCTSSTGLIADQAAPASDCKGMLVRLVASIHDPHRHRGEFVNSNPTFATFRVPLISNPSEDHQFERQLIWHAHHYHLRL